MCKQALFEYRSLQVVAPLQADQLQNSLAHALNRRCGRAWSRHAVFTAKNGPPLPPAFQSHAPPQARVHATERGERQHRDFRSDSATQRELLCHEHMLLSYVSSFVPSIIHTCSREICGCSRSRNRRGGNAPAIHVNCRSAGTCASPQSISTGASATARLQPLLPDLSASEASVSSGTSTTTALALPDLASISSSTSSPSPRTLPSSHVGTPASAARTPVASDGPVPASSAREPVPSVLDRVVAIELLVAPVAALARGPTDWPGPPTKPSKKRLKTPHGVSATAVAGPRERSGAPWAARVFLASTAASIRRTAAFRRALE
mmetsp:Transcript_16864/g.51032  ORF Transcript_16864/g.51032 Transcript_16864/m.51032 type:complete len:320 (-) Transcript_16864:2819-3778(-)